jgi:tetratricopeptide (TPR) repeat protein/peroxiredoxin
VGGFPLDPSRRNFLVRSCQAVSSAFLPGLNKIAGPFAFFDAQNSVTSAPYHLHPRYRARLPLEATLLKTDAARDRFPTEKYAAQIEAVFADWSEGLRASPDNVSAIQRSCASDFVGTSWRPGDTHVIRSNAGMEVRRCSFASAAMLGRDEFMKDLQSSLSSFAEIHTAEFQVTAIDESAQPAGSILRTLVRYEIAGRGREAHREQRIGEWGLEWSVRGSDGAQSPSLTSWRIMNEKQARAQEPIFVDIAPEAFTACSSFNRQLAHGSDYWRSTLDAACGIDIYGHNGVAVGDIDGDGFDDLYICQPAGLPNRLYRNRGDGTFEDITEQSGLGLLESTACALFADFDNDGHQDLVVVRTEGPLLLLNDGKGKFRKRPDAFRFAQPPQGTFTGAAVADYDRDGWLDIYFCLYLYYQGAEQYKYPLPYFDANNGPPNFLMRNQHDGTFRDVTAEGGLDQNNRRYSFCCAWLDSDRGPDLYVVNDFGRKNLYRNNGDGTFQDVAAEAGVEDVGAGMSICALDVENHCAEDLYVANMWTAAGERITAQKEFQPNAPAPVLAQFQKHSMGNSLFQREKGSKSPAFQSVGDKAGARMGRWSWSSDAWDFDHDGFPDLYVTNGMISGPLRKDLNSFFWRQVVANSPLQANPSHDYEQGWNALNELIRADETWSGYERNVLYANNRNGTFSDVSAVAGMDFVEDGRSFALADFDHDGRLEVLLKNRNGPQVRLLKNVIKDLPPSIAFRLRGTKSNRDGIGAVVTIETSAGHQTRCLQAGSGFLSQHTKELFFGLGDAKGSAQATIRWPDGLVQQFRDLPQNHRVWIEEGKDAVRVEPFRTSAGALKVTRTATPEQLPENFETWLISPFTAPDFSLPDAAGTLQTVKGLRGKPVLLVFWISVSPDSQRDLEILAQRYTRWSSQGLQLLAVNCDGLSDLKVATPQPVPIRLPFPNLKATDDVAGVYNILYRYLFDRHRDLTLPTCFLVDAKGEIVKIYQGPLQMDHVERDFQQIPRTAPERIARALPFPGVSENLDPQRNYLSFGSVFFQSEYFGEAEASFQLALKEEPESAEAHYGLGSVYLKQQKRAEALVAFQRATKLSPAYPDTLPNAWNNLGLIATQEDSTEEAVRCFQQALLINPDHLIALDNLGNALRKQKRWDEARKVLQHALEVSPEDPEANYSLGMVFAQSDETQQAYEFLQKALHARPDYPEALNNLGVLYLRTGRRDLGVETFERCIRVAPDFDQAYLNLARVHALEGNLEQARTVLSELLKRRPDDTAARKALAELGQ